MGQIKIPASPATKALHMGSFIGADLTGQPAYIDSRRSPDCPNMIRESAGKVRKWIGWHTLKTFSGRINGFHQYAGTRDNILLVHAGTKLIDFNTNTVYRQDMADARSTSAQLDGKLIIADGKRVLLFYKKTTPAGTAYTAEDISASAYVPVVVIGRSPQGGGTSYQPINLMGDARTDSFLGTAGDTYYQLSATNITGVQKVEIMDSAGNFSTMATTKYDCDTATGKVRFYTAPGASPLTGHDNIRITYLKSSAEYRQRINGCNIMTMYGVDGLMDRVFLSGNPDYPNRDYHCEMDDPTYWPDINYSVIGADKSRIMGYSIINNTLATHLNRSDTDTTVVLRQGTLDDKGQPAFKITHAYQGRGTVSQYAFGVLETEPLFLTDHGIMALTPSDVLGERYAQLRSYYLNGLLLQQDLTRATACTYDRFYMLAAGGYLFALDGTQAEVEPNQPYAKRQYSAFYRTNVPARVLANVDETLMFGTEDGRVCAFYKDYDDTASFNDDGRPVCAHWTTPEIAGGNFYYKKRYRLISAMLGSAIATSVRVKALYDGMEELVAEYRDELKYFSFSHLNFGLFSFKTDSTAQIIREKISIKPENKKVQFVFENNTLNQPFALYDATIEYTESR